MRRSTYKVVFALSAYLFGWTASLRADGRSTIHFLAALLPSVVFVPTVCTGHEGLQGFLGKIFPDLRRLWLPHQIPRVPEF